MDKYRIKVAWPSTEIQQTAPFLSQWKLRVEYASSNMRRVENVANSPKKDKCWLHKDCDGDVHPIWRCRLFQSLSVEERRKLTKANKACTSCLQLGHSSETCSRRFRCQEKACTEYHNHLLHWTLNMFLRGGSVLIPHSVHLQNVTILTFTHL